MYTQDELNAAVAAALEKVAALCGDKGRKQLKEFHEWCKTNKGPATCYGEFYIGMEKEINAIPRDTTALDEYKKDAERWRFVMNTNQYSGALWEALPLEIWGNNRHLNNAIDEAMEKDGK